MCFRLKRKYRFERLYLIKVRLIRTLRSKLFYGSSLDKSHVVLIGRNDPIGVRLGGLFNELKEGRRLLYPINNKSPIEYLMAAVFGIDLREAKDLRVGKMTPQL